ncbi:MAG: hypothetical protein WCD80_12885 [Desulfobaccales bacterium]
MKTASLWPIVPALNFPGVDREEAQANIKEAIIGYLESLKKHGEPIPPPSCPISIFPGILIQ